MQWCRVAVCQSAATHTTPKMDKKCQSRRCIARASCQTYGVLGEMSKESTWWKVKYRINMCRHENDYMDKCHLSEARVYQANMGFQNQSKPLRLSVGGTGSGNLGWPVSSMRRNGTKKLWRPRNAP